MTFTDFDLALHVAAFDEQADSTSLANAAAVSTEAQTTTIPVDQVKFGEISGGSSPRFLDCFIPVTSHTVAGGTPKLGYSFLRSSVLALDQSEAAFAEFEQVGSHVVATSFIPSINVMQARATLADNVAHLGLYGGSNVITGVRSRVTMFLVGVLEASLHAVIFRFVRTWA